MWHASVMVRSDGRGPVPWPNVGLKLRGSVKALAIGLLDGVGVGDIRRDRSEHVLHARRRLSAAELAAQTPEWHSIEAVDSAGEGIPW